LPLFFHVLLALELLFIHKLAFLLKLILLFLDDFLRLLQILDLLDFVLFLSTFALYLELAILFFIHPGFLLFSLVLFQGSLVQEFFFFLTFFLSLLVTKNSFVLLLCALFLDFLLPPELTVF
jgi:hypothetical protein